MIITPPYLEGLRRRLDEVERELSSPEVTGHSGRMRAKVGEHARLRDLIGKAQAYLGLVHAVEESRALLKETDDAEMAALARAEIAELEQRLPATEKALLVALLPPDPNDGRNLIMEIRAGTGGDEAALFAADLYRMYSHYAESQGWTLGVVDLSEGTAGGFKEIVFSVEGADAYRQLQYESGTHRVQRVPATEAQGRIHTSAATVAVLPEAADTDEVEVKPEDLRIDLYRASGPGGQKVNKTESAVRLTHLPTGLVVQSQDERSQSRNKDRAMRVLKARLLDHIRSQEAARQGSLRRSQIGSGDRSERIRTYNFPQNRLTDHRINLTLYQLDRIIEGALEPVVSALNDHDLQLRLQDRMKSASDELASD